VDSEFVGFRLLAELGRGAFGCVFLAEPCQRAGGRVVLKISVDQFDDPPAQVFRHPHIIPREPSRRSGGLQAVAMPCRGNTTLGQLLQQLRKRAGADRETSIPCEKETPVDRFLALRPEKFIHKVLDIGCRLADGLTHAHMYGVCHRNLKPSNVLLGDDDQPALLDFDLVTQAKWREHSAMSLVSGRLAYAGPEVLLRQHCSDPIDEGRSDVYALGAMLFELLTGSRPFHMRRGPLTDVLLALTEERRKTTPADRQLSRLIAPAAARILRRCVEPDPRQRTASARELRDELRHYVGIPAD
jgi:serine/threonine protein kinase